MVPYTYFTAELADKYKTKNLSVGGVIHFSLLNPDKYTTNSKKLIQRKDFMDKGLGVKVSSIVIGAISYPD